jgi:hypothetical protein
MTTLNSTLPIPGGNFTLCNPKEQRIECVVESIDYKKVQVRILRTRRVFKGAIACKKAPAAVCNGTQLKDEVEMKCENWRTLPELERRLLYCIDRKDGKMEFNIAFNMSSLFTPSESQYRITGLLTGAAVSRSMFWVILVLLLNLVGAQSAPNAGLHFSTTVGMSKKAYNEATALVNQYGCDDAWNMIINGTVVPVYNSLTQQHYHNICNNHPVSAEMLNNRVLTESSADSCSENPPAGAFCAVWATGDHLAETKISINEWDEPWTGDYDGILWKYCNSYKCGNDCSKNICTAQELVGEAFRITSDIAPPDDRRITLFSDIIRKVIFDVRKKYSKITPGNTFRYWAVPEKLTINLYIGRGDHKWDSYGWVAIDYKINPNWSLL